MFQMTEVGVPQPMVVEILSLIVASTGRASMRGARVRCDRRPSKKVCLDAVKAARSAASMPMVGSNAVVHAVQDFLLSKTLKRAILASQSPRIRGMLA